MCARGAFGALALIAAATCAAARAGDQLTYVESSAGLETPVMEAGRTEIEFGDVNGDGHLDIVSIGDHGSPFVNSQQHGIMVWFGDGSGVWSVFQNGAFGYGGVALGDVNHDGLMDVGYGMHHDYSGTDFGDQILEVALGDGTGTSWTPWDDGLATNGETWGMFGTDFADVDNDGDLDVGSISFGCCAGLHVYLNNGDGTWTQNWGFLGGNASMLFEFADFNADGNADFAAAHGNGTVYLGDGTGAFALADGNLPGSSWRRGVSAGDVTGDGRDDLAFRTAAGVAVWTMTADAVWQDVSGSLATIGSVELTEIADMNLDGAGDVVVFAEELVRVYADDGGGWQLIATITLPEACDVAALRAGIDADHNGFPDIALIQEEDCGIFTAGTNRPRFYRESSVPESPWIVPRYPRGGETFVAGSVRFVDWHAAVPDGAPEAAVTIELSTSGPGGPWTTLARSVPDNGRFQWHLADVLPTSTDCFLRYTLEAAPNHVALTPAPFAIAGGDTLVDVEVVTGTHVAGGLADLVVSDDAYLRARSAVGFSAFEPNVMEVVIGAVTAIDAPAALDIAIESRLDNPNGTARVRFRSWETGQFEEVAQYDVGTVDQTQVIEGIDATGRVRESDGRIELSDRVIVIATFSPLGFDAFLDLVSISAR